MPRINHAIKPFKVHPEVVKTKIVYIIISDNGYTYHHSDNKARYRRLKDERTYTYSDRKEANMRCKEMNKIIWW